MTTAIFNTNNSEVEDKILNTSSLVTTTVLNTKISEVENEIPDHAIFTTTPYFNKSTARLKEANLVTKTDFCNKLTSINKRITSNKTKHLV